jgi:hypothetical protein
MAQDLKLEIVIQALLDAKGFEDAKANLEGLTGAANKAGTALPKTGDGAKKMGESFGGSRGPIADVTRVLLMNAGVTGAVGEAAKAAGTAMYFMEGAATAANVAITGGVAAIAFLLPMLIKWASGTEEQKKEQVELKKEIDATIPIIESYARQVKVLNEAARLQLAAKRNETLRAEAIETEHLKDETEVMGRIQAQQIAQGMILWQKDIDAQEKRRGRLMDLLEAQRQGITVEELYEQRIKASNDAQDKATKAAKEREAAQERLNKAIEEGIQGQSETRLRGIQAMLDKDSEAIRKREQEAKRGKLSPELLKKLTEIDIEKKAEKDLADYEAETEELKRQEKRKTNAAYADAAAQGLAAASSIFGNNKALAIASAIADTYKAANMALASPPGPPVSYAYVAAAIATGLANVKAIRDAKPGFDDPFADLTARQLGRKSAVDFVANFGAGFHGGMRGMQGGGGNSYSTTINRGMNVGNVTVPGFMGAGRTEFMKHLRRELIKAERLERRTTLGR